MWINTKYRAMGNEIMDDFSLKGSALEKTLLDLDKVNKLLGGTRNTMGGLKKILSKTTHKGPIKVLDVGCGNGSILREIAEYGQKRNLNLNLMGIDANPHTISIARKMSSAYPNICFESMNVFSEEFKGVKADLFLCTLTLHHFDDEEIPKLLKLFLQNSKIGVVINDLQRSKIAYYLFQGFCAFFIKNEIARKDGLTSILRGFKRKDLLKYASSLSVESQEIISRWAFRYQWILTKN